MTPYLSIEALTVSYGTTRVLDQVSLSVQRGEMIALLGSSGCGKTTLLRSIAGFVLPDSGAIRVDGKEITRLPPEARETAMMFQSYALQQRIGSTAVYVTHDREEALTLADRIAVIDAGRIVQIGAPEEIFHRPTSAFVAGFMGADNALDVSLAGDGALKAIGLDATP